MYTHKDYDYINQNYIGKHCMVKKHTFMHMGVFFKRIKQSGRSMIEMIAVVAAMGIIVTGMGTMAGKVMKNRQSAFVVSEVVHLVSGAKDLLTWYPDVKAVTNGDTGILKYLLCEKWLKSTKILTDTDCKTNMATATTAKGVLSNGSTVGITLNKTTLTGEACSATSACQYIITITISDLNKSDCIMLASTDWGRDFVGIGKTGSITYVATNSDVFPMDELETKTMCSDSASNTLNILFF